MFLIESFFVQVKRDPCDNEVLNEFHKMRKASQSSTTWSQKDVTLVLKWSIMLVVLDLVALKWKL